MVNLATVNWLPQVEQWEAQIPRLEDGWWPTGGAVDPANDGGLMNWQAQLLGNRTAFLKRTLDDAGIGATVGVLVADLNTITRAGTYRAAAGAANAPVAGVALTVEHFAGADTNNATQEARSIGSDRLWTRRRAAGAWQPWREVALLGAAAGLVARAADGSPVSRSVAQGTGITVTNGNGEAGNPTIAVDTTTAFGSSLAASGWQRLPSGLIMQWGTVNLTTTATLFSLPITYPTAHLRIVGSDDDAGAAGFVAFQAFSTSQLRGICNGTFSASYISFGH